MASFLSGLLSPAEVTRLMNKERDPKKYGFLTGAEAVKLGNYKRSQNPSGSRAYSGTSHVTTPTVGTNFRVTPTTSTRSSTSSTSTGSYRPPARTTTTTGGGTPGGGATGGGGWSPGQNIVQPTINPYTMRSDDVLRQEASQAAAGIYNPIMNALNQRQADYQRALEMGKTDLAAQYAQQIADLKALALSAETAINQRQQSTAAGYDTALANMAQQTQQSRASNQTSYDALQGTYGGELNQLGIGNQVRPETSKLLRDKTFTDAMLQGIGNIGQTGLQAGKTASDTAMSQLAANNTAQFGSLQGQARIGRDQNIRDLEQQILDKVMEGSTEIGKTQSEWNSKAYELLKALQDTEWSKYIEAGGQSFGQGLSNAQLAGDLLKSGTDASAAANANLSPTARGYAELQKAFGSDPNWSKYEEVWNLINNPRNLSEETLSNYWDPNYKAQGGYYPGLQGFLNDPQMASRLADTYARTYGSLAGRGLLPGGRDDPNWVNFQNAMNVVLANKNYGIPAIS